MLFLAQLQRRMASGYQKLKTYRLPPTPTASRTYKEQLYDARRCINHTAATGAGVPLSKLNHLLKNEGVIQEIRARRSFVRPAKARIEALFRSRQGRFNAMFKQTLGQILEIHASQR